MAGSLPMWTCPECGYARESLVALRHDHDGSGEYKDVFTPDRTPDDLRPQVREAPPRKTRRTSKTA